jgi:dUTP pyrophosphatase
MNNKMEVKLLNENARLPTLGSSGAAGFDICSTDYIEILPNNRNIVSTGLSIKLPVGVYGRIAPRSGLAVKHGIHVGAGVIDRDYRGEIKVLLFNLSNESFTVNPGDRIAQLICEHYETPPIKVVDELDATERGQGGFGSTGFRARALSQLNK